MTRTFHSDDEIRQRVELFQQRLIEINLLYKDLTAMGLASDFYIGPNLSYTYLPDKVIFKRTIVTRFE